jgi:putative tryptophan/tyrosine transport system substrate-binding protein
MKRRIAVIALCLWQAMSIASAEGQKKIVVLRSSKLPFYDKAVEGFKKCLGAKGIAFTVEDQTMPDTADAQGAKLAEIKGGKPDLVLTLGTTATRAAQEKMPDVPSVFCMVLDPTSNQLTGGGVSLDLRPSAQVDFIQKNLSQFKKVGVIYNPQKNKETAAELKSLKTVEMVLVEATGVNEMEGAITGLKGKADCLLMVSDPSLYTPQMAPQLILQTLKTGLPLIAISPAYVKAGALVGIYADYENNGCLASDVAARVLKGEKSSAVPLAWPTKVKSSVNQVVADRLGVKLSPSLLSEAEEVIK